eukprot:s1932_g4.t3
MSRWILCLLWFHWFQVFAVDVPFLEAARWALSTSYAQSCADSEISFEACAQPWAAVEAWRYACANLLASEALGGAVPASTTSTAARSAAQAVASFFATPDASSFAKASAAATTLRRLVLKEDLPLRSSRVDLQAPGLGVPVLIQKPANLQLKGGTVMPLMAFAVSGQRRPSVADIAEALRLGVRHLQVSPSVAHAVSQAIRLSQVPRVELFISLIWEAPLDSAVGMPSVMVLQRFAGHGFQYFRAKLQSIREELGVIDLMVLPRSPQPDRVWRHLQRPACWILRDFQQLKAKGLLKALGVKDFKPEEVEFLPHGGAAVEYALCAFTPYRHGPSRSTWRLFGQRSIALAATGLLNDWPRPLRPREDPHVLAIARRVGKTGAQVLLRWALQLGLAVTFHTERPLHVAENLGALEGADLSTTDLQLLSGLATLAEPFPPGDGFAHPYEKMPIAPATIREL